MTTLSRRSFLAGVSGGAAAASLPFAHSSCMRIPGSTSAGRPNVVVIMADDMGYSDLGCYGGEIATPNLDRMAGEGVRFTQFYNAAKCTPSRASLLTGQYAQRTRAPHHVTIAEVLRDAGYGTYISGKFHPYYEYLREPCKRGFDRAFGLLDGAGNHFNPGPARPGEPTPGIDKPGDYPTWVIDDSVFSPYTPEDPDFYSTDSYTDKAIEWLSRHDKEKPFFLYLAYTAPHWPLHAFPEDIAKYRGRYMDGWDALRVRRHNRLIELGMFDPSWAMAPHDPEVPRWDEIENKEEWDLKMAVHAAMVDRMDRNIGRLMAELKRSGTFDNTIVVFLSDNGASPENRDPVPHIPPGPMESFSSIGKPWAHAANSPFRKWKLRDEEGGICTPCIVWWPKGIQGNNTILRTPAHVIDIMPTVMDYAGVQYPRTRAGTPVLPMDGVSLRPIFDGESGLARNELYWFYGKSRAMRQGKWKIVTTKGNPWELYDMSIDPCETVDLAGRYPEITTRMGERYEAWTKDIYGAGPEGGGRADE